MTCSSTSELTPNLIYQSVRFIKICHVSKWIEPCFVSGLGGKRYCPLRLKVDGKKKHPFRKFLSCSGTLSPSASTLFSIFSLCCPRFITHLSQLVSGHLLGIHLAMRLISDFWKPSVLGLGSWHTNWVKTSRSVYGATYTPWGLPQQSN